jgi:Ca2+-binding EF-hand superfamily protein
MLLGQDSTQEAISIFFPPGQPQRLTLAQFLTQLSALLSSMSRPDELNSAFAAFDDDDNGQIDVNDLQDALLHTAPEQGSQRRLSKADIEKVIDGFTSRKTVGKRLGREDVFRYQEFLAAVTGFGDKPAHDQELRE